MNADDADESLIDADFFALLLRSGSLVDFATHLWLRPEIKNQANLDAGRFQVVDQLRFMLRCDSSTALSSRMTRPLISKSAKYSKEDTDNGFGQFAMLIIHDCPPVKVLLKNRFSEKISENQRHISVISVLLVLQPLEIVRIPLMQILQLQHIVEDVAVQLAAFAPVGQQALDLDQPGARLGLGHAL